MRNGITYRIQAFVIRLFAIAPNEGAIMHVDKLFGNTDSHIASLVPQGAINCCPYGDRRKPHHFPDSFVNAHYQLLCRLQAIFDGKLLNAGT